MSVATCPSNVPAETRPVLIRSLEMLRSKREELPKRKHGNVPL